MGAAELFLLAVFGDCSKVLGMKNYSIALAGLLFASVCHGKEPAVAADGAVVLAMEDDSVPVGKVQVDDFSMEMKEGTVNVTMPDRKMEGVMSIKETRKIKTEGLEKGKVRVTVIEETKTEQMVMAGQAQPVKTTENPLKGVPVIAERGADGKWSASLEDAEPTPEMAAALEKISDRLNKNLSFRIYGSEPRKVGDEWEVKGDDLMGIKGGKGTVKVKFEAIEEFKGEKCAKLTGSMNVTGETPAPPGAKGMDMGMAGDFTIYRSLEHRVDLSNVMNGKMGVGGEMSPQPGLVMTMKMEGPMEMVGSATVMDAE